MECRQVLPAANDRESYPPQSGRGLLDGNRLSGPRHPEPGGAWCTIQSTPHSLLPGRARGLKFSAALVIAMMLSVPFALLAAPQAAPGGSPSPQDDSTEGGALGYTWNDGWPDLSNFLDEPYGFLPMLGPVTEPAVGYGVYGGPAFIDKPSYQAEAGFGRPNISFVGGVWTENGTWAVMGADYRQWMDEQLNTVLAGAYASINLDFHGIGQDGILNDNPIRYTMTSTLGALRGRYRLGRSCFWLGLAYMLAFTTIDIEAPENRPRIPDFKNDTRQGGFLPGVVFDSRNNIFTPTGGTYLEVTTGFFSEAFGGDADFQRLILVGMHYFPLHPRWTWAVRGDGIFSFNDCPFFLLPAIALRGVPQQRYQGKQVAMFETELRWQFWKRWSLVGFAGYGMAWNDFERLDNYVDVITGGGGFRYDLAARYGLHFGVDVGFAPDGAAIYVVFGSAWSRP